MNDEVRPPSEQPAATAPAGTASGTASGTAAELSAKAVDTVDLVVNTLGDRAVRPVLVAARAVVFGLVIAVMAVVIIVLASVSLVRLLHVYAFPDRVWAAEAVVGFILVALGLVAWSQRTARPAGKQG